MADAGFLKILQGPQRGTTYAVAHGKTLGRDDRNEIHLTDETASRRHSILEVRDGRAWVVDLGSRNGTIVNGGRIPGPTQLKDGDQIVVGSTILQYGAGHQSEETVVIEREAEIRITSRVVPSEVDLFSPHGDEDPDDYRDRVRRTVRMAEEIVPSANLEQFGASILEQAMRLLPEAHRFAFILFKPNRKPLFECQLGVGGATVFTPSRAVVREVVRKGEGIVVAEIGGDDRFKSSKSIVEQGVQSALAVPINESGAIAGLLYADARDAEQFNEESLLRITEFASRLGPLCKQARTMAMVDRELAAVQIALPKGNMLIAESREMRDVVALATRFAAAESTVLLQGETGTGKELFARLIHSQSLRAQRPFVPINCGAISDALLESELFGHDKGAFTGADTARMGKFLLADGGTLFLDEIGEIPLALQVKLLRVLQEKSFFPVGSDKESEVDIRVIAATNRDLMKEVEDGKFRADLLYRLQVLVVEIPPLRRRIEDIPPLARHFTETISTEMKRPARVLSPGALSLLKGYRWPGNVRELRNVLERAVVLCNGEEIGETDLPRDLQTGEGNAAVDDIGAGKVLTIRDAEKIAIERALTHTGWKKGLTAELLGVSWPTLNKKIGEYGIEKPGT